MTQEWPKVTPEWPHKPRTTRGWKVVERGGLIFRDFGKLLIGSPVPWTPLYNYIIFIYDALWPLSASRFILFLLILGEARPFSSFIGEGAPVFLLLRCSLISNNDGPGVVRTERIVGHIHIFIPLFYFVSKITVQRHSHIPPSPSSGHNNDQWLVSNLSLAKECRTWLPIGWLWLSSAESPTQISNYCIHNYV